MNLLPVIIFLLAITGDGLFFRAPAVAYAWAIAGWVTMAWAGWLLLARRGQAVLPHWDWLRWLLLAVVISTLANPAIYQASLGRLWLVGLALAAMILAGYYQPDVLSGLYRAGWLYAAAGWWANWEFRNVAGFWAMLFFLAGLSRRSWLYLGLYALMLAYWGSRGAILGTAVGLAVYLWPFIRTRLALIPLGLAGLAGLAWLRPATTLVRLHYWQRALAAFGSSPLFGLGPGGLKINNLISDGGGYQIHAHNALLTWTAETGLVGLICLAIAAVNVWRAAPYLWRWQAALLAGLAAHSLVDEPLFWPGPLLAAAIVLSSIKVPPKM